MIRVIKRHNMNNKKTYTKTKTRQWQIHLENTFKEWSLRLIIFEKFNWIDWFEFPFMMRTHQKYPAGCHGGVLTDRNLSFPPLNNKDTQTWSHASLQSCKNWISFSPHSAARIWIFQSAKCYRVFPCGQCLSGANKVQLTWLVFFFIFY